MSQQLDTQGEAHEALGTAVASYGQRVLSDPHTLGNLVADLLPDLPRERSLLVTAAEAGVAGEMRQHVEEQHIDPDTAAQLVARSLSERRAIDPAASMWVASEYAQALGYQVRPYTSGLAAGAAGEEEAERAGQELALAMVADWRSAVADQLGVRPYTVEEQFILDRSADTPVVPYGSTLLVAVIAARWLVCAQIGDGDMLAVRSDGSSFAPVAGDDRLDGRRTTSLCQPDALASFRTGAHDLRQAPLAALLLATDGYGNAQADEPWQPSVGRDLAELAACRDRHWFGQEVPGWAERCASAEGSGDDATIALVLPGAGQDGTGPGAEEGV